MKRILTAVVLIPVVLALILRAPVPLLTLVVAAVALIGVRELLAISEHYGVEPMRRPTYIAVAALFAAVSLLLTPRTQLMRIEGTLLTLLGVVVMALFVFLAIGMKRAGLSSAYPAATTSMTSLLYVALPLALLIVVRETWAGGFLLLYLLLVVWAGDTFAYYTGRAFGRHKLAPRVSPGKTWEGAAGSMAGALLVGWAVLSHAPGISRFLFDTHLVERNYVYLANDPPPLATVLLLSAAINIAAQFGDLVESLIKRGAGIKDSGALLPGHGGILDRIDALLFAGPVLWYYLALIVTLQGHI